MKTRAILVALLMLALTGCASRVNAPSTVALPVDPAAVPLRVALDRVTLELETYLNRDFMPITPPNGMPLTAFLRVRSTNGAPLPVGLTMTRVGVYFQGRVWSSAPEGRAPYDPAVVEALASGGPKWGPGGAADVVVILSLDGEPRALLRSAGQPIHRSD